MILFIFSLSLSEIKAEIELNTGKLFSLLIYLRLKKSLFKMRYSSVTSLCSILRLSAQVLQIYFH
jgi:hypothetical protein